MFPHAFKHVKAERGASLAAFPGGSVGTISVEAWEIGRLSGRHREQARSYNGSAYTFAFHHSSGRALARLQLLILIHPPPRQAEWRRSSGGRRAAPFDAVEHIERRSKRSRPEAMPPDECRSEGTPSPGEGPYVRGERFFGYFF